MSDMTLFEGLVKQSYFVVGTDTDAGKTYVSCRLIEHFVAQGIATVGMKPIASGCQEVAPATLINEDARRLALASNINASMALTNPYRFLPAIAPHIAASQVAVDIEIARIVDAYQELAKTAQIVVVEGAGGFLVPINASQTLADLALRLNLPLILVVGMRLGCINHALLTVEAIQSRGLSLGGWVANELSPDMPVFEENLSTLRKHIAAPFLGVCRFGA